MWNVSYRQIDTHEAETGRLKFTYEGKERYRLSWECAARPAIGMQYPQQEMTHHNRSEESLESAKGW